MRISTSARALLLGLLVAGCGGELVGGGQRPTQVLVVSGDLQTGPVGQELAQPLVVRVVDESNRPVPNQLVNFVVTAGGGSVFAGAALTNAQGEARERWRLGPTPRDTQRVEARAVDPSTGAPIVFATFRAVGRSTAPGTLFLQAASNREQFAPVGETLPDSLAVRVVDELGNGIPDIEVSWVVPEYAGTLSPTRSTTGLDGIARTEWTLGIVTDRQIARAVVEGTGQMTFAGTGTSAFTITIEQPRGDRTYGDSLPIRVTAQSTSGPLARVTARVADRSVNLSGGQGTLDLSGLAEGEQVLLVSAVTTAGDSALAGRTFILNRAPQLTVAGTPTGAVIRDGTAEIDAGCADPSGCTRVAVYAGRYDRTLLAEGTTGFHGSVSVAAYDGAVITLTVEATDGLGGITTRQIYPVYVEDTPTWDEVASAGVRALDVDATRILYVDSAGGRARVLTRPLAAMGSAQLLLTVPAGVDVIEGRLFAGGAIFSTRDGVYESRGGTATRLAATPNLGYTLDVEGDWAIWNVGNTLYRRNLAAGTTGVVSTTTVDNGNDVAPTGQVAYRDSGDGEAYLWSDGARTAVSAGLGARNPRTDGTQVLFASRSGSIYARRATPVILSTLTPFPDPPLLYQVNGGWAAFVRADVGGLGTVWTLDPDGVERRASSGGNARIAAIGPDGAVVFIRHTDGGYPLGRLVVEAPYTTAPVEVGGDIGEMRYEGDDLLVYVGRSVFRVTP